MTRSWPGRTTPAITQAASRSRSSCTSGPTSSTSPGSATPASSPLGRFAQGSDAGEATADQGRDILEHSLTRLHHLIDLHQPFPDAVEALTISDTEEIWQRIAARQGEWSTLQERDPLPGVLASAAEIGLR